MSRPRKHARPLVVDVNGVEIKASLRPQRSKAGNWELRCLLHGKKIEESTGTPIYEEAKRIARQIIRGEEPTISASARIQHGLTVREFEQIQRDYHARNARREAGDSTLKEFMGVWQSFLRVCPVKTVHEVTEQVALKYLGRLQVMSKTENRKCKKKSSSKLSVKTIHKHIRTLAGAWNLVREGHPQRVGGLHQHQLVQSNPWQAIRNNIPQAPLEEEEDPVQFELEDNDLGRFLDQFKEHPVGEIFIIASLWCWGRINETTRMEWSWIQGEHVIFPKPKTKGGRGKIARLPPVVAERLKAIRDSGSPYVFARWVEDVRANAGRPTRVQTFCPRRMRGQMEKLIPTFAEAIGRPEIRHHALRRTAMELGEEAELRLAEKTSAEKLQTTVGNKRKNYTKRLGKKAYTFADGLYSNLTTALNDFPDLAKRLGCEPLEMLAEQEAESLMQKLTPLQRQRLARRLLDTEGDSHGVA
jgi:integrase